MADERLRELERRAAAGDGEAAARLERERARLGQIGELQAAARVALPCQALVFEPQGQGGLLAAAVGHEALLLDPRDLSVRARCPHAAGASVAALAFEPGGRTLASGGGRLHTEEVPGEMSPFPRWESWEVETEVRLWSREGGSLGVAGTPRSRVRGIACGGEAVLCCAGDGLRRWRAGSELVAPHAAARVLEVALDAAGRRALTLHDDGQLLRWRVEGQRLLLEGQVGVHREACLLALDAEGRVAATADQRFAGGALQVWDVEACAAQRSIPRSRVTWSLAVAPGGRVVAAGDVAGAVLRWRDGAPEGELLPAYPSLPGGGTRGPITGLVFSDDGASLAARDAAGVEVLGARASGRVPLPPPPEGTFRRPAPRMRALAFDPDGARLACGLPGGRVAVLSLPGGAVERVVRAARHAYSWTGSRWRCGVVAALRFSSDGALLEVAGDREVTSVRLRGRGRRPPERPHGVGHVAAGAFAREGALLLASDDATHPAPLPGGLAAPGPLRALGVSNPRSVAMDPTGAHVLVHDASGVLVLDGADLAPRCDLETGAPPVAAALQPDGARAAVVTAEAVCLFDLPGGARRAAFSTAPCSAVAFSVGGTLAVGRADGRVELREASGALLAVTAPCGLGAITAVALGASRLVASDGRELVSWPTRAAPGD